MQVKPVKPVLFPFRLFGLPLNQLCTEEEPVPRQVQDLLLNLFRYGPAVTGIFRKSANARVTKEVKQRLDEGTSLNCKSQFTLAIFTAILAALFAAILSAISDRPCKLLAI